MIQADGVRDDCGDGVVGDFEFAEYFKSGRFGSVSFSVGNECKGDG